MAAGSCFILRVCAGSQSHGLPYTAKHKPDMPDRIITATALAYHLPLVTRDSKIREAGIVRTIW